MFPASRSGSRGRIAVGVYDEPELIVSGVGGMLSDAAQLAEVRAVDPDDGSPDGLDVLLCDPIGRTLDIEEYLARVTARTDARVIAFTWRSSHSNVRRVLAAGAKGFVSKMVASAELADAVRAVHDGGVVAPETRPPAGHGLSQRESEVLELICRGLSNNEIADRLYVSVNSVKTYVRQVYQKIGVSRRAQAVAWGLAHGF